MKFFNAIQQGVILAAAIVLVFSAPSAAKDAASAQREDLAFLRDTYMPREKSFSSEGRQAALSLIAEMEAKAGTQTDDEFLLGVMRVCALTDNAHSLSSSSTPPNKTLPFVATIFDGDNLLIMRAREPYQALAGNQIAAIDGVPIAQVLDTLRKHFGGIKTRRDILITSLMTRGGILHTLGIAKSADKVKLSLASPKGEKLDVDVAYVSSVRVSIKWYYRWWSPEPVQGDVTNWNTAITNGGLPLYLQNANAMFRVEPLPELDAAYVQFKSNDPEDGVRDFARTLPAQLGKLKAKNLIVDMRFNFSGDQSATADLFKSLPGFTGAGGRIFIIIGRYTFSAGMVSTAMLVKAAGDRATLVGEPVGDRLRFWSEGKRVCLPNSQVCTRYTDGLWDLANGCAGEDRCYPSRGGADYVVGNLNPAISAPFTTADYLAKRDPAMEAIARQLSLKPQ